MAFLKFGYGNPKLLAAGTDPEEDVELLKRSTTKDFRKEDLETGRGLWNDVLWESFQVAASRVLGVSPDMRAHPNDRLALRATIKYGFRQEDLKDLAEDSASSVKGCLLRYAVRVYGMRYPKAIKAGGTTTVAAARRLLKRASGSNRSPVADVVPGLLSGDLDAADLLVTAKGGLSNDDIARLLGVLIECSLDNADLLSQYYMAMTASPDVKQALGSILFNIEDLRKGREDRVDTASGSVS